MAHKKITVVNSPLLQIGRFSDILKNVYGSWVSTAKGVVHQRTAPSTRPIGIPEILFTPSWQSLQETSEPPALDQEKKHIKIIQKTSGVQVGEQANIEWTDTVNSLVKTNIEYEDFATNIYTSPVAEEILNTEVLFTSDEQGAHFIYNLLDAKYEEILEGVEVVTAIPSMYAMLGGVSTLDGEENILKKPLSKQLEQNVLSPSTVESLQDQIIPIENNSLIQDYSENINLFPMYVQINLTADRKSEFATILKDTATSVMLIRDLVEPFTGDLVAAPENETLTYSTSLIDSTGKKIYNNFTATARTMNLMEWWDKDSPVWFGDNPLEPTTALLGPETPSGKQATYGHAYDLGINLSNFYDQVNSLAQLNRRTYLEILDGVPAYSETIFYKIAKYHNSNPESSSPVQTFHVANFSEISDSLGKIRFMDTQVKYGEEYTYVVTAYQAIVGCKYEYSNVNINHGSNPRSAEFDVSLEPVVKIVEIPLFISSGLILNNPPLPPDVSFIPYKGHPSKIMMFFGSVSGYSDLEPIPLNEAERADYDQVATNQGRSDGLVTFQSDDSPSAFQIYRTSKPPVDYLDFENALLTQVSTDSIEPRVNLPASTAPVVVQQPVNKKFYYMFRTVDYHGGLSNPTPVYEIELYGDSGVGYPIIREYQFNSVSPKTPTKSARKMIQIVPRMTQAYLNEEASGLAPDGVVGPARGVQPLTLGVEDDALFGKRFKVRLTSKTTGKKVDINIDFKTKRVRAETE